MSELRIGREERIKIFIDESAVTSFAALSGDTAPLHTDEAFARSHGFSGRLVHGALLAAFVSRLVGMVMPGAYSILERMDLAFRLPCYAPCELEIAGRVRHISEAVSSVLLEITIQDGTGRVVATGKTWHRMLAWSPSE